MQPTVSIVLHEKAQPGLLTTVALPPGTMLRVGQVLELDGPVFRVLETGWDVGIEGRASARICRLEPLMEFPAGRHEFRMVRQGYALAWITLSDKGAVGTRTDESGPLVAELVGERLELSLERGFVLPDEELQLRGLLVDLLLNQGFDLVVTTGGTGVSPRDVTPEATLAVIEKRLPGFERAMTNTSLSKTPHGAISRAVVGTLGQGVVVNLPGSPKGVRECLEAVLPGLKHALRKLQGDPEDCAQPV